MKALTTLHPRLRDHIANQGWKGLTEIQEAAFFPVYEGQDCVIEAPTAGGKTEAVLFPLLGRLSADKKGGVRILYLAPLKALLNDLELRVDKYARLCGLSAFKWHGDVSQSEKINQMLFPAELVLTTPESLEAILLRKSAWYDIFANLESVVIDEAHAFALSERGAHLVCLLERLQNKVKNRFQRIAITATIGNPGEMAEWMTGGEGGAVQKIKINAAGKNEQDFRIHFFAGEEEDDGEYMNRTLYQLLLNKKSIVFRNSRSKTEDTARYINELNQRSPFGLPLKVRTHHSSVSKYFREAAEQLIKVRKETSLNAIISTSTLELGIDIGELDQVIQLDDLCSSGSFLQRVGRTGRRPGRPQVFRGLTEDKEGVLLLAACTQLGKAGISESIAFPAQAYHILAHQIICMVLQERGCTRQAVWKVLSKAHCFRDIPVEKFNTLIDEMVNREYLRIVEEELLLTGTKTEEVFLRANWNRLFAIFDTGPMYEVVDGRKIIGTLDCSFVMGRELPFLFVLGGIEWKANKVNHETRQVAVRQTKTGMVPKWKVFKNSDIPFEVAQEVGRLLMGTEDLGYLDTEAKKLLDRYRAMYGSLGWEPGRWVLTGEEMGSCWIYTFAGDKINRVLAVILEAEYGVKTEMDYRCVQVRRNDSELDVSEEGLKGILDKIKKRLTDTEVIEKLNSSVRPMRFSKFADCLPESLQKEAIVEKVYDAGNFLKSLSRYRPG